MTLEARFWSKVNRLADDECWLWTASVDTRGYGQINCDGVAKRAHLQLGNHETNMADMREKGRRKQINTGQANGRAKLTVEQVRAIRTDLRGKRAIALEYGISPAQAQRIRNRQQWIDV